MNTHARVSESAQESSTHTVFYRTYRFTAEQPYIICFPEDRIVQKSSLYHLIHFHNAIEIGYCHQAEGTLMIDGNSYQLSPDSCFIIPPYRMHAFLTYPKENSRIDYLYYDPQITRQFLPRSDFLSASPLALMSLQRKPFLSPSEDKEIIDLIRLIFSLEQEQRSGATQTPRHISAVISLLNALSDWLYAQLHDTGRISDPDGAASRAIAYINQHFREDIDTSALADSCGKSLRQLRNLFSSLMGCSMHDYLIRLRLDYATTLLLQTGRSILQVAGDSGFQSLSAFQNAFRSRYGIPPSEWKASHLADRTGDVMNIVKE